MLQIFQPKGAKPTLKYLKNLTHKLETDQTALTPVLIPLKAALAALKEETLSHALIELTATTGNNNHGAEYPLT